MTVSRGDREWGAEHMSKDRTTNHEKVFYEELQPDEFVRRVNDFPVAYLPLGTLEWHGLHLPLGADGIQAKGVFEKIASKIGGIVLPMLFLGPDSSIAHEGKTYYGMDEKSFKKEPQQLEGSAYYISDEQFRLLIDSIMHNLQRAGFKIVVAHGHGPSTQSFARQKQLIKEKHHLITFNLWELGYEGEEGIQTDHAAANETSLVMAMNPELVSMQKLALDEIPVGVWGKDPRRDASREKGDKIIAKNVSKASMNLQKIARDFSIDQRALCYQDVKNLLR